MMFENPFYDAGSVFFDDYELDRIPPTMLAGEALAIMRKKRFHQLPVVDGNKVIGIFSLWSIAEFLALPPRSNFRKIFQNTEVRDLLEEPPKPKVDISESVDATVRQINLYEALLLISPFGLQAIITAAKALNHYYQEARPFMLLREIELGLRRLVEVCVPEEKLKTCVENAIAGYYFARNKELPSSLKDMSFEDYRSIITCPKNSVFFEKMLGRSMPLASMKLEKTRKIRNDVCHFKGRTAAEDADHLLTTRNWIKAVLLRHSSTIREQSHVK